MEFLVRTQLAMQSFPRDRRAVTAIEYALIASLVAVAILGGLTALTNSLSNTFNYVATKL